MFSFFSCYRQLSGFHCWARRLTRSLGRAFAVLFLVSCALALWGWVSLRCSPRGYASSGSHFPKIIFGCCFSLLGSSSCNSVSGAFVSIHVEVASLVPRPPSGSGCSVLPNTPTQGWLTSRCMSQGMVLEARGGPRLLRCVMTGYS